MSFVNNPVVSDLMAATGLNQVLGNAATQSAAPPKSPQMRPEYQVARPPVNPRFAGPQAGAAQSQLHVPGTEPGLMSADTLNSPTVHDLLGHYGVSAPANIDDHLFIHDPQAFAKHPMIASMIENGLGGLANYHTGQDTASTLSNIAGSVIGNQSMHAQAYNNRAMAPIMQAQQIGNLMENKQRMDLQASQAKADDAHAGWYENQFDLKNQMLDLQRQRADDLTQYHTGLLDARNHALDSSPAGVLHTQYTAKLQELAGPGGDPTKLPADVQQKAWADVMANNSVAKSAGALGVRQATPGGKSGRGGGASGKLDAGSAATDRDIVTGLKNATGQYAYLDSLSKMSPSQRTLAALDPKNSKYGVQDTGDEALETQKKALADTAGKLHSQRAKLYASRGMSYTGIQPDAPSAPAAAPASGNPFRQ